jgi:PBP1b-binding outer membrane lipoprotein LpoB
MKKFVQFAPFVLGLFLVLVGCDTSNQSDSNQSEQKAQCKTISPGDSIILRDMSLTVPADGRVNLPYVGNVEIQNLTNEEAEAKIDAAYAKAGVFRDSTKGIGPAGASEQLSK